MNCQECAAELIEGAKFCSKCGDSVGDRDVGTVAPAIRRLFRSRRTLPVVGGATAILAIAVVILAISTLGGGDTSETPVPGPTGDDPSREQSETSSKSVSVSVSLEGAPPPGFEAGIPKPDADTVTVTGTPARVTLVTQAMATLDLTGRTEDTTREVRLEPRDSRGFLVEGVSLEPSVVNVTVEIVQAEFSRVLTISPAIIGSPEAGYDVVSTSVDPAVITVFGPQAFLEGETTIRTQPVDITGTDDDVVLAVALDLPADVSVSGEAHVTVTVVIQSAEGRQTLGVTVVAVGLDLGLSISGSLPIVEVVLLGDPSILEAIEPNDIAATVNLAGLKEGKHTVSVSVSAPPEASVASVSPEEVEIRIEKR